ncbi:MAG: hypothetical protein ACTSXJ_00215 [Candidatus Baldrarchaeia archaeon]
MILADERAALRRLAFEFLHKKVKVMFLRDFPEIDLGEDKIGPFKKGDTVEMYLWLAKILSQEGIARIEEGLDKFTSVDLYKILRAEIGKPGINPLPEMFYLTVREQMESMKASERESPHAAGESERLATFLRDIMIARLNKIIKLALQNPRPSELNALSQEEKVLYEKLSGIIRTWIEEITGEGRK